MKKNKPIKLGLKKTQEEILKCLKDNISFELKTKDGMIFYIAGKDDKQGILGKSVGKKNYYFQGAVNPRLGFLGEWIEI